MLQGSPRAQASKRLAAAQPGQSHSPVNGGPSVESTQGNRLQPRQHQVLPSHAAADGQPMSNSSNSATGAEAHILAELDRLVGELHTAMPVNTLLLVYTVQVIYLSPKWICAFAEDPVFVHWFLFNGTHICM